MNSGLNFIGGSVLLFSSDATETKGNKGNKRNKRKQISPIFGQECARETRETGGVNSVHSGQASLDSIPVLPVLNNGGGDGHGCGHEHNNNEVSEVTNINKRQKNYSEIFAFDTPTVHHTNMNMNNGMSSVSNFPQSYTSQLMQPSPPYQYTQQFMTTQPGTPMLNQITVQPPPWAISIMDDIKTIKSRVEKIDNIEKLVNSMNLKLNELDSKVKNIESRVIEVEATSSFIGEKYDQHNKELTTTKEKVNTLQQSCKSLNTAIKEMAEKQDVLKSRILDHEYRNMRENLIFYGIPEGPIATQGTASNVHMHTPGGNEEQDIATATQSEHVSCDYLIKQFIKEKLKICTEIELDRAHRLGGRSPNKTRPIVVKFHNYSHRELVRNTAFSMRDSLKREDYGVGTQLPKEWRQARKKSKYSVPE